MSLNAQKKYLCRIVKDIRNNKYFSERNQHKLELKLFHTVANCITDIDRDGHQCFHVLSK